MAAAGSPSMGGLPRLSLAGEAAVRQMRSPGLRGRAKWLLLLASRVAKRAVDGPLMRATEGYSPRSYGVMEEMAFSRKLSPVSTLHLALCCCILWLC
ncbi:unnamed protein product [Urochloa humidicola]